MNHTNKRFSIVLVWLLVWLVGSLLGTLVQSQVNLQALQSLGVLIPLDTRFHTTLHDLGNFSPVYAVIFGCSFAVSQAVALLFTRFTGTALRTFWCVFGAVLGLWVTFKVVDMIAPMPILISSTRTAGGMFSMLAAAAVSGALFAKLSTRKLSASPALVALLIAGIALSPDQARAQSAKPYTIETFADGLDSPWSMAFLPDGRALITEKPGQLRLVAADGKLVNAPIAGVPKVFYGGQAGLFDVLPSYDFAQSQQIFISYACGTRSANHLCVASASLAKTALRMSKKFSVRKWPSQAVRTTAGEWHGCPITL